jgi:ubiquinone/menaquinone biosynthesis C-methylase UbiE
LGCNSVIWIYHPLAAGTGEVWAPLLKAQPQIAKITAIDISHQMHLLAIQSLHQSRSYRIEHIQADFLTSALPAQAFDAVICSFGVKMLSLDQQAIFAHQLA